MKPGIVSGVELATYLKVDRRTINKLAVEGRVIRADSGQGFKLLESIQTYCVHMREVAAARDPSDDARAAKVESLLAGASLKEAQKALLAERLKRELSDKWCLVSHVCEQLRRNASEFRAWALDLPPRIRHALDLSVEQEDTIERIVDAGLRQISEKVHALDDGAINEAAA